MSTASDIVKGLGGRDNITDLEPCITRLRVEVVDQEKVDEEALRAAGAFGVVRSGRVVQVVVGPTADTLASEIAELECPRPVVGRSARHRAAPASLAGAAPHRVQRLQQDIMSAAEPDAPTPGAGSPQSAQRGPDAAVPPHPRVSA